MPSVRIPRRVSRRHSAQLSPGVYAVPDRPPAETDAEVLPEPVMARLLTRASELDAARGAGATVIELRAAAVEAGISPEAFDAALAELRGAGQTHVQHVSGRVRPRRRPRMWALASGVAALIVVSTYAVGRTLVPANAAVPMVQESILLRCLSPGEAAELIRPLLDLRTNTVVYSPAHAPRTLTIRATPTQIRSVRSALEQNDGGESSACAAVQTPS